MAQGLCAETRPLSTCHLYRRGHLLLCLGRMDPSSCTSSWICTDSTRTRAVGKRRRSGSSTRPRIRADYTVASRSNPAFTGELRGGGMTGAAAETLQARGRPQLLERGWSCTAGL